MSVGREQIVLDNPLDSIKQLFNSGKESWKNREHIVRLTNFYSKYNPSKINSVISLVSKYEGRELEMYNTILSKYGVDALSPADRTRIENTYVLHQYYQIHNPEKIDDVPTLIKKYQNDYDRLFQKMEKKYGIDPRQEVSVPRVGPVKAPQVVIEKETKPEEYSDYSYSEYSDYSEDEDDKRRRLMIQRAASRNNANQENNLLTNLFESSKKLISEISTSVTFDGSDNRKETRKPVENVAFGSGFIAEDKAHQLSVSNSITKGITEAVEKVDNNLSILVGSMQDEDALWKVLCQQSEENQSSVLSSYQTRLNGLLDRIKSIELFLTEREGEVERQKLAVWKEQKAQKFEMLKEVFDEQLEEKKEEIKERKLAAAMKEEKPAVMEKNPFEVVPEPEVVEPVKPVEVSNPEPVHAEQPNDTQDMEDDLSDDSDL